MIVESMTWEEAGKEIANDVIESDIVLRVCNRLVANHSKYRKAYGNRIGNYCFSEFTIKSKRNNVFYILPIAENKAILKKQGPTFIIAVFFRTKEGNAVASISNPNVVEIFHAHLFDRFQQRFTQGDYDSTSFHTFALQFIAFNFTSHFDKQPNSKYGDNAIICKCKDGVLLGYKYSSSLFLYKTYISDDMQFDAQREITSILEKNRLDSEIEFQRILNDPILKSTYREHRQQK